MNLNPEKIGKYMEDSLRRMAKDPASWINSHYLATKYVHDPFSEHVISLLAKIKEHIEENNKKNVQEAEIVGRLISFLACAIVFSIQEAESKEGESFSEFVQRHSNT